MTGGGVVGSLGGTQHRLRRSTLDSEAGLSSSSHLLLQGSILMESLPDRLLEHADLIDIDHNICDDCAEAAINILECRKLIRELQAIIKDQDKLIEELRGKCNG